jgi:hypothetical protein
MYAHTCDSSLSSALVRGPDEITGTHTALRRTRPALFARRIKSKKRHDVGYRKSRPRARINQRYDSLRIRAFVPVLQNRADVLGVRHCP